MVRIQNETTYKAAMERIEELLPLTDDNVPLTDKNLIELDLVTIYDNTLNSAVTKSSHFQLDINNI